MYSIRLDGTDYSFPTLTIEIDKYDIEIPIISLQKVEKTIRSTQLNMVGRIDLSVLPSLLLFIFRLAGPAENIQSKGIDNMCLKKIKFQASGY